ncbi:MAG: tRNA (N6-threonylcarbamoyladenosine(37)-N6)-methyltransferase TrmO [Deltaproteobacteria bacterium]|nr:tRNA (N6-threonylcarbamoyladenosine(37)-N6)-methyltransferase TrmO [Deltaproteobacteria bacterium]
MVAHFKVVPVGIVRKNESSVWIEIEDRYRDALYGLDGFSHIDIVYWFHQNDIPEKRSILKVHPRHDPNNPETGVFGTHAPVRPNPIGITRCRILKIDGPVIFIDDIDAFDGSPVIDIKCYLPPKKPVTDIRLPDWA